MKVVLSPFLAGLLFFLCSFLLPTSAEASTADYFVTSGTDTVSGSTISFITLDVTRLGTSNNDRKKSAAGWPSAGAYDENKYLEFIFTPTVPSTAIISSVVITHEWRNTNTTSVGFAKLEVWDGNAFSEYPVTASVGTNEITETTDISSHINTPAKVSALKVRFLAYRNTFATLAETSHDLFKITAVYDLPVDQTITFDDIVGKTYGDAPFEIVATSTSGLPVTISVVEGPATLSGSTVTLTGAGTVTIRASHEGSSLYNAAFPVDKTFSTDKAVAIVTLSNLGYAYDGTAKSATATTTPSGLSPVSFTYNGTTTPPTEAGSYEVVALLDSPNYAGNATSTLVIHTVVPPSADVPAGTYTSIKSISLTATSSESVHYTIDGTVPTCSTGEMYASAITLAKTRVLKSVSCYSKDVSSEVSAFSYVINLNIAPGDLGSAITHGVLTLPAGAATSSTLSITAAEEMKVTVAGGIGAHFVTLPAGVVITHVSGGTLDASLLSASAPAVSALSGFDSGKAADGVLQWGIGGESLQFSVPISLSIFAGTDHNGEVLYIERSVSGTGGWTSDGIVAPATCTVSSGACSFQATKASYYAAVHTTPPPASATPSSQSSSGGGGGGGGGRGSGSHFDIIMRWQAGLSRPDAEIDVAPAVFVPADVVVKPSALEAKTEMLDGHLPTRGVLEDAHPTPSGPSQNGRTTPTVGSEDALTTGLVSASGSPAPTEQLAAVGATSEPFTVTGPMLSIIILLGALGVYAIFRYP